MMVIGVDAHKRSHTAVIADEMGRKQAVKTAGASTEEHLKLLRWANPHAICRFWAIEDFRHLSRRLERDLIAAREAVVRVPPKLMAHARDSARTYGKSDPIDALAVARAALREPDLPVARLDGPDREPRLLVDHRRRPRQRAHLHHQQTALAPSRARSGMDTAGEDRPDQRVRQGHRPRRLPRRGGPRCPVWRGNYLSTFVP